MTNNYILYVAKEANFASRIMLIPSEEYIKARNIDYQLLKENAKEHNDVNNVIIQKYKKVNNKIYNQVVEPFTSICNRLTMYADGTEYIDDKDEEWYNKAIVIPSMGFNHINNYRKILKMKEYNGVKINIIDSFLVLEEESN